MNNTFFHTHSNDDDDDDSFDGVGNNNNKNNFNNSDEAFSCQLVVYTRYAAMQSESVLWTAGTPRLFLSSKA